MQGGAGEVLSVSTSETALFKKLLVGLSDHLLSLRRSLQQNVVWREEHEVQPDAFTRRSAALTHPECAARCQSWLASLQAAVEACGPLESVALLCQRR